MGVERFDEFWTEWPSGPRKVNKKGCCEKWKAKKLDEKAEVILGHIRWSKKNNDQWKGGFVPMPMTYLNQERWEDGRFDTGKLFEKRDDFNRTLDPSWVVQWIRETKKLTEKQITGRWEWIWDGQSITGVKIPDMPAIMFKDIVDTRETEAA